MLKCEGKCEEKRPIGRLGRGWKDNIKIDLQEIGWEARTGLNWLRTGTRRVSV